MAPLIPCSPAFWREDEAEGAEDVGVAVTTGEGTEEGEGRRTIDAQDFAAVGRGDTPTFDHDHNTICQLLLLYYFDLNHNYNTCL